MPITKTRTRRELAETIFYNSKHRPVIIEIWGGTVYAWPKGFPKARRQISIGGSWCKALVIEANIPHIRASRRAAFKRAVQV